MPLKKIRNTFELIKFSHSIFAMPFALGSMLIAAHGMPAPVVIFRIILALVFARTSAMAFNRWLDADIDAKNPRTQDRHIPAGSLSKRYTLTLTLLSSLGFIYISFLLGSLCFYLSPLVLLVLFFYSYTKRFSSYTQLFLGLALGIAPVGAWIAVTNSFNLVPILLCVAVLFWVAGFDILYATQDYDFDKATGLHSMVVKFGIPRSLIIARFMHAVSFLIFLATGFVAHLHWPYFAGLGMMAILFVYQHSLIRAENLSRIDAAFFKANGLISLIFLAAVYFGLQRI